MAMAAATAARTMTGVLAWRAEAPLEKGFVPALAAPTGTTLWEGDGLEAAAAATPGVGEPLVDLEVDEEPAGFSAAGRQEVSLLAPIVIVLLHASLSWASTRERTTCLPAGRAATQLVTVPSKSPMSTRAFR